MKAQWNRGGIALLALLEAVAGGGILSAQTGAEATNGNFSVWPIGPRGQSIFVIDPTPGTANSSGYRLADSLSDGAFSSRTTLVIPKRPRAATAKPLKVESFGSDATGARNAAFTNLPDYATSLLDLHDLECPMCVAAGFRSRFAVPPFGANVKLTLFDGRFEVFGRIGGVEATPAPGSFRPQGLRLFTSPEDDAWLTQVAAGSRVAVDPQKHLWLGGTAGYFYSFGAGPRQWNSVSGQATFKLGH